jgi:aminoglycoside phosphotransferase family enzyme
VAVVLEDWITERAMVRAKIASWLRKQSAAEASEATREAINWAHDPLAGGAYSYATPETRGAVGAFKK